MALPPLSSWRVWLGVAAMTLGLALAAEQLVPGLYQSAPEAPQAQPLKSADPSIRLTETADSVLSVYADVTGAKDAADNFDKSAALVAAVGRAVQHGVSDNLRGVQTIRFIIRCEAINRFGQDVMAPLATVDLPLVALKAADYAKARPARVLGLAQAVTLGAPGAYDAIAQWCADAARGDPGFCRKAQS